MTEQVPLGFVLLFSVAAFAFSALSLATGFHPRYRRRVHWGRHHTGPTVSRLSHVVLAIAVPIIVAALVADGYFPEVASALHMVGGAGAAAGIVCIAHDAWVSRNDA